MFLCLRAFMVKITRMLPLCLQNVQVRQTFYCTSLSVVTSDYVYLLFLLLVLQSHLAETFSMFFISSFTINEQYVPPPHTFLPRNIQHIFPYPYSQVMYSMCILYSLSHKQTVCLSKFFQCGISTSASSTVVSLESKQPFFFFNVVCFFACF